MAAQAQESIYSTQSTEQPYPTSNQDTTLPPKALPAPANDTLYLLHSTDLEGDAEHKNPYTNKPYSGYDLIEHAIKDAAKRGVREVEITGDLSHNPNLDEENLYVKVQIDSYLGSILQKAKIPHFTLKDLIDTIESNLGKYARYTQQLMYRYKGLSKNILNTAFDKAKPYFDFIKQYLPGTKVNIIPGNHDHADLCSLIEKKLNSKDLTIDYVEPFTTTTIAGYPTASLQGASLGQLDLFSKLGSTFAAEYYGTVEEGTPTKHTKVMLHHLSSKKPKIILAHTPALEIHDKGHGDLLLQQYLAGNPNTIAFVGHIHEAPGVAQLQNGSIQIQSASAGAGPNGLGVYSIVGISPTNGVQSIDMNIIMPTPQESFITTTLESYIMGDEGKLIRTSSLQEEIQKTHGQATTKNHQKKPLVLNESITDKPKPPIKLNETITDTNKEPEKQAQQTQEPLLMPAVSTTTG